VFTSPSFKELIAADFFGELSVPPLPRIDTGKQLPAQIHRGNWWLSTPEPCGELSGARVWRFSQAKPSAKPFVQEIGTRSIHLHMR